MKYSRYVIMSLQNLQYGSQEEHTLSAFVSCDNLVIYDEIWKISIITFISFLRPDIITNAQNGQQKLERAVAANAM